MRVSYPRGFCPKHARVHAAACASTLGTIVSIWPGGLSGADDPCVGVQFGTPTAAAKMQYLRLPEVEGVPVSVQPWKGPQPPAVMANTGELI